MRDIKFRGKSLESGEWLYGSLINNVFYEFDLKKPCFYIIDSDKYNIEDWCDFADLADDMEVNIKTVGQYTGLKDKNEKEIYEGDIVEGGYLNPLTGEFLSKKYVIEYKNAQFKGKLIGHSPYGDTSLYFINGEVIDNIYDNPELLQEGQR